MITIGLGLLWLALLLAEGTPLGKRMRRVLIEAPVSRLARVKRRTVITIGLLATMVFVSAMLLDYEAMVIAGLTLPEIGTVFASAEMTVWLDAVIAVAGAASLLRAKSTLQWAQAKLARPRPRTTRTRRTERPDRAANDDEPGAVLAAA